MLIDKKGDAVDAVAQATEGERDLDTELVGKGAGEETNDSKGGVESDVRVVGGAWVSTTSSSETTEGVEHAWAEETDQGDEQQLGFGAGVWWNGQSAELGRLILP